VSNGLGLASGVTNAAVSTAVFLIPKFSPYVKFTESGEPARSKRLKTSRWFDWVGDVKLDRGCQGRQEGTPIIVTNQEVADGDVVVDDRDVVGVGREAEPTEPLEIPAVVVVDITDGRLEVGGVEREEVGGAGKAPRAGLGA